ncbi:MAG: 2-amino-4-hydroxy-6-hydroxymethyldihydropteridine diphosphokinase [Bacteroidales bacterium]|nr:2-amino-4-hydroxy-6-hydroxymethyldihydropteridine diphosphokinase [Bacteroidales bacterium]MCM1147058.1 2-amino-4-hydroxy-6-hydroxymethyldihydropteridine diphosphokinase [Bacteroidales bacterium]MCM1205809.1 2-amino-4-hydroxy-6-hydroxymethyldihydropteridine diphosphokinase [Bacillota bacterium]MCM1509948.1 2-amino-4-hydroxy-6-hydroxymethyldihydropteridine diphosphokinase [Clostridium sp.]
MEHTVYLGLGSNLGDKERNILAAIDRIGEEVGAIVRRSSFLVTEPWGFSSENTFVNAAVRVKTEKTPAEVLRATQQIECEMGRTVKSVSGEYHDRNIDIDILLYDDIRMSTEELTIPHPLMYERDFVMTPLGEIL